MSADYQLAQDHLVPRSFMFNSNDPVAVVIHKTGGDRTPADVYRTFINSGNPGKSSHYAIGLDGSIWQYVPESLGAGANGIPGPNMDPFWKPYLAKYGNLNCCTISIEHCDPSINNDTPLTAAQKEASFNLVAHLCKKYNIPASHIKPHKSIAATACPGNYPMDELIAFVQNGGETEMLDIKDVGSFFTEQGGIWKCKNGNQIIGAMLDFFRKMPNPLAFIGLPRTNEVSVDGHPGCKIQMFERIVLAYDPSHVLDSPPGAGSVYAMHIDDIKSQAVIALLKTLGVQVGPSINAVDLANQLSIASNSLTSAQAALSKAQASLK